MEEATSKPKCGLKKILKLFLCFVSGFGDHVLKLFCYGNVFSSLGVHGKDNSFLEQCAEPPELGICSKIS